MAPPSVDGAGHDAALHLALAEAAVPLAAGPGHGAVRLEIAAIRGVMSEIRVTAMIGEMRETRGISVKILMVVTSDRIGQVKISGTGIAAGARSGGRIVSRLCRRQLLQAYRQHQQSR